MGRLLGFPQHRAGGSLNITVGETGSVSGKITRNSPSASGEVSGLFRDGGLALQVTWTRVARAEDGTPLPTPDVSTFEFSLDRSLPATPFPSVQDAVINALFPYSGSASVGAAGALTGSVTRQ